MLIGRFWSWNRANDKMHTFVGGLALGASLQSLTTWAWLFILSLYLVWAHRLGKERIQLEREETAERGGAR